MVHTQPFGQTQHNSTAIIFGAFAVNKCDQAKADSILDLLLQHGINHIDTAAAYGDSELRLGPWMSRHREDFFLATKTGQRTYIEARKQIDESLRRLQVDYVDLIQLHNLVDPVEWETAMGAQGALQAALEAREQGKVRFIGVTGHGLTVAKMHMQSLSVFPFDSVLLPWNYVLYQNESYRKDFLRLQEECQRRDVAIQTIKGLTRRPWGGRTITRNTWYEPFEDPADIDKAVHWILGQPGLYLNTAGDPDLLPRILQSGERFQGKPADPEMEDLIETRAMVPLFHA